MVEGKIRPVKGKKNVLITSAVSRGAHSGAYESPLAHPVVPAAIREQRPAPREHHRVRPRGCRGELLDGASQLANSSPRTDRRCRQTASRGTASSGTSLPSTSAGRTSTEQPRKRRLWRRTARPRSFATSSSRSTRRFMTGSSSASTSSGGQAPRHTPRSCRTPS